MIDSDDELAPYGLESISRAVERSRGKALLLGNARVAETECLTGRLPYEEGDVALDDYLAEQVAGELMPVVSREVALLHPYPDTGAGGEGILWGRLIRRYGAWATTDVFVVRHTDAADRLTAADVQIERAAQNAAIQEAYLAEFGVDLLRCASGVYERRVAAAMVYHTMSGSRNQARGVDARYPGPRSAMRYAARGFSYLPPAVARSVFRAYRTLAPVAH
jgi:hypothetical protein